MEMKKIECKVSFVTPAFLGGADQSAQWRTPPFKALIRQWWRVAECAGKKPNISLIHKREGQLFGRAADKETTASKVRLKLDWRGGHLKKEDWNKYSFSQVDHPEVKKKKDPSQLEPVGVALYLGYGPVGVGNKLQRPSFLAPGESRALTLLVPAPEGAKFAEVMRLTHLVGTVGGRCRNGWGSLHFDQGGLSCDELASALESGNRPARDWLRVYSRPWRDALDTDWCHALGRDEKGLLIWRTEPKKRWEDVLKALAEVKITFRTQFHFQGGGKHANLCDRQLLAYPITNHELWDWEFIRDKHGGLPRKDPLRSANQVLFKAIPANNGYVGIVVHLPHSLSTPLAGRLKEADSNGMSAREREVWNNVHEVLDKQLTRLP